MTLPSIAVVTPPAEEPVALAEAKNHLRVEASVTDDDGLIGGLIQAAREWTESWCGRTWVTTTYRARFRSFPAASDHLVLPRAPVTAITDVTYVDADGATQTASPSLYAIDLDAQPPRFRLAFNATWPTVRAVSDQVALTFTAGYGNAAAVPASVKAAMLLLIGNWYGNRESVVIGTISSELPMGVEALLAPYRVHWI